MMPRRPSIVYRGKVYTADQLAEWFDVRRNTVLAYARRSRTRNVTRLLDSYLARRVRECLRAVERGVL